MSKKSALPSSSNQTNMSSAFGVVAGTKDGNEYEDRADSADGHVDGHTSLTPLKTTPP
jgi:hypothetical protein